MQKGSQGNILVGSEITNVMIVPEWFFTYRRYHSLVQNEALNLTDLILGERQKKELEDNYIDDLLDAAEKPFKDQLREREFCVSTLTDKIWDKYP